MATRPVLAAMFTRTWDVKYRSLAEGDQKRCDRAVLAILRGETSPGLRIKPIQPDKVYQEARLNKGDRIVFRIDKGAAIFLDIVTHDEIARYGKR